MTDFERYLGEMERLYWPPRLTRSVSIEDYEIIRTYFYGCVGRNGVANILINACQHLFDRNPEVVKGVFSHPLSAVENHNLTSRECSVVVHYLYHEYGLDSQFFYQRLDNAVFFEGHAPDSVFLYIPSLNVSLLRA